MRVIAGFRLTLNVFILSWTLASPLSYADCRGCCNNHGGVTCRDGITQCRDGSPLSKECAVKSCNQCKPPRSPKKSLTQSPTQDYHRKHFRHWIDEDGDCQNTRAEVLISTSEVEPQFKDSKKCVVESGQWLDPYTGNLMTRASEIDIDHIVPLKYAFENGAKEWPQEKKEKFANDFENLIPAAASINREKGAQAPPYWMPPRKDYHCTYLEKWVKIRSKYGLLEKRGPASVSIDDLKAKVCTFKRNNSSLIPNAGIRR